MIDFTIDTRIDRPPSDVFAYICDPEKLATWQTSTVSAVAEDGGPLTVGSRVREIHRTPGGKELESLVEVAELEPDRTLALRVVEGTPVHLRIELEPAGAGGTVMHLRAHGRLTGAMRLAEPLLGRVLARQFRRDSRRLAEVLGPVTGRRPDAVR